MKRIIFLGLIFISAATVGIHLLKKNKRVEENFLRHETFTHLVNEKIFQDKLSQQPPLWVQEQIDEDFAPFIEKGIAIDQVDATFATLKKNYSHPWIYRYRIINNELYRYFPEGELISLADNPVEKALKTLLYYTDLTDIDFILSYIDGVPLPDMPEGFYVTEDERLQAPLFFSAKVKKTPYIILIPDWRSVSSWWARDIQDVLGGLEQKPWDKKKEQSLWRGSLTRDCRLSLCEISLKHPDILDARLSVKVEDPFLQKKIEEQGVFGEKVSWETFLDYKYLPILDGVCCAAPAFQWRLLSSSLTLKQESDEIQWFYRALSPYIHYLPIKNDLSDLIEKITWAKEHDDACQKMARHAQDFALHHLMMEDVYLYFYLALKQYSLLQPCPKDLKERTESDPRWVNIQSRRLLKKQAKKVEGVGYTSKCTPYE